MGSCRVNVDQMVLRGLRLCLVIDGQHHQGDLVAIRIFFLSYLWKEELQLCNVWWRQEGIEKLCVFSIGIDFE